MQHLLIVVCGVIILAAAWFGRGDSGPSRSSGSGEPAITDCPACGSGSIPCKCVTDPLDD
ncbi:hypothetical protein [Actinocatenispora thailandica]|uniref:hypothetical protein n=1 Tax=Actinocatenispora thailandica TaxID=227318 RepID=UPI001951A51A|nr:hypothetical protein [Actinocatenispora thailandica]